MKPGLMVAIEGLDAVGKSALVENLARHGWVSMATPGPALKPLAGPFLESENSAGSS